MKFQITTLELESTLFQQLGTCHNDNGVMGTMLAVEKYPQKSNSYKQSRKVVVSGGGGGGGGIGKGW